MNYEPIDMPLSTWTQLGPSSHKVIPSDHVRPSAKYHFDNSWAPEGEGTF